MRVTFWGVRGSIPLRPRHRRDRRQHELRRVRAGKAILIFDGGTGLRLLGKKLLKEMPLEAHIFFSHVHWDHIQGFPFFDPAFVTGNEIHLYGGNNVSRTLEETLAGQMDHPSFPVHLTDMGAKMTFNDLHEGQTLELPDGRRDERRASRPGAATTRTASGLPRRARRQGGRLRDRHRALRRSSTRRLSKLATQRRRPHLRRAVHARGVRRHVGRGGPKMGWGHSTFDEAARAG